ncbi:MAG: hypothetical protein V1813_04120 [Candidatus Aenigmatarchaeota archaeon]
MRPSVLDRMKLKAKNRLDEDVLYSWEVRNLVNNVRGKGGHTALKKMRPCASSAEELGIEDTVTVGNDILFYPVSCIGRYFESQGFYLEEGQIGDLIKRGYTTKELLL